MKKIALSLVAIVMAIGLRAQHVEYYENPQRYEFPTFSNHSQCLNIIGGTSNNTFFFSRKYHIGNSRVIYGVAIPMNDMDLYIYDTARWQNMLNYYDTSDATVILGSKSQADDEYDLNARVPIRIGETAIVTNLFKMPDSDSASIAATGMHSSVYFPVLEVYFEQPITFDVNGDYLVGFNLPPMSVNSANGIDWIDLMPVQYGSAGMTEYNYATTSISANGNIVIEHNPQGWYNNDIFNQTWGGPFPIVAPAPCVPPIRMSVKEQHRQGATIKWRGQYGTSYYELEYGLHGFPEGSGTTVGPIAGGSDHTGQATIEGLQMDEDYTARVRSYCVNSGFSDWTELDFHTNIFYHVATSVNDDSCGYIVGGGSYPADTTIRLYAYPKNHKPFLNWSDGSTQNPRVVTLTKDTAFHAIFNCNPNSEAIVFADSETTIYLSPNPCDGICTLSSNHAIISWAVYTIQGKNVKNGTPASPECTIDLSELSSAVYILRVQTEKGYTTKKIIVR